MKKLDTKTIVVQLRKRGKTYTEIQQQLDLKIAKSTLSYWLKDIPLTGKQRQSIQEKSLKSLKKAQRLAVIKNRQKRKEYLESLRQRNQHLLDIITNKDVAKIALTMLYLGEGSKTRKGSLMFGNSDPFIIDLFLRLLRRCYKIDETKFRCTLQCRADQRIKTLEKYWSKITKISLNQFYTARIDKRTVGKPSKNPDYKGVCRIDYFSAGIFNEIKEIIKIIHKGP